MDGTCPVSLRGERQLRYFNAMRKFKSLLVLSKRRPAVNNNPEPEHPLICVLWMITIKVDKLNRCLAQESISWGKNGRFWAKHPNYFGREQKFWYPHIRKPPRHLVCIVIWSGMTSNGSEGPIFGPKWPKMHIFGQIWPFLGQKS